MHFALRHPQRYVVGPHVSTGATIIASLAGRSPGSAVQRRRPSVCWAGRRADWQQVHARVRAPEDVSGPSADRLSGLACNQGRIARSIGVASKGPAVFHEMSRNSPGCVSTVMFVSARCRRPRREPHRLALDFDFQLFFVLHSGASSSARGMHAEHF